MKLEESLEQSNLEVGDNGGLEQTVRVFYRLNNVKIKFEP